MRVYILDDDNPNRQDMLRWLFDDQAVSCVDVFDNYLDCVQMAEACPPDICFIRLGLAGIPGLKTARMVHLINPAIRTVFLADDRDYALDAYEVGAYGYLLSPVNREKFEHCLLTLREGNSS